MSNARYVPIAVARLVRERAEHRCEYCQIPQYSQHATFHIDHVRPYSKGGRTELMNLALACVSCSLKKSDRTSAKDPLSGRKVAFFNPRLQDWNEHFKACEDGSIKGLTRFARTTLEGLSINRPSSVKLRRWIKEWKFE